MPRVYGDTLPTAPKPKSGADPSRAPVKQTTNRNSTSGGVPVSINPAGGSGGGDDGSSGIGANPTGQVSTKAPISKNQFLANDTTYQGQQASYQKALQDYIANQTTQKTNEANTYQTDLSNLTGQQNDAEQNLLDDYSSRGLATSGLYAKDYGTLQDQYGQQMSQLNSTEGKGGSFYQQLAQALAAFTAQQQTDQTSAKQDAVARYAAKYGV